VTLAEMEEKRVEARALIEELSMSKETTRCAWFWVFDDGRPYCNCPDIHQFESEAFMCRYIRELPDVMEGLTIGSFVRAPPTKEG
jgi:hypothetical protein